MFRIYRNADELVVELPENIFEKIKNEVKRYYPHECGGIFIGRITNNNRAIIEDIIVPKEILSTRVLFRRIAIFINRGLKKIFNSHKGEIIYLGEWHSHPDNLPIPSRTDMTAMQNIAKSPSVRTETPLLLIVGFNQIEFNEKFYLYFENQLLPYEKI